MRLALFQPEIAGNVGTVLRLAACFGVAVDIIEPCGFPFSDRSLKRAGLDYAATVDVARHPDWRAFEAARTGRLALLTTRAEASLFDGVLGAGDVLMLGSESAGAPAHVHAAADLRLRIPIRAGFRSLNMAVAAGIALAEAMRQADLLPR